MPVSYWAALATAAAAVIRRDTIRHTVLAEPAEEPGDALRDDSGPGCVEYRRGIIQRVDSQNKMPLRTEMCDR